MELIALSLGNKVGKFTSRRYLVSPRTCSSVASLIVQQSGHLIALWHKWFAFNYAYMSTLDERGAYCYEVTKEFLANPI